MAARRILCFGPFVFDPTSGELRRDGEPVHIPPKAASVLQVLLERPLELVRKEEILDACWDDAHVGDSVLKVAMRDVRRALGDDAARPNYIQTVHRRGYRLAQRVTVRAASTRTSGLSRGDRFVGAGGATAADRGTSLVGRDEALHALAQAYRAVEAGMPRIVYIEGEAGAGKSVVLASFIESLPRRVRFGLGAGAPDQRTAPEPFGPVLAALAVLGRTHSSAGMDDRVVRALVDHAPTWVMRLPALLAKLDPARIASRAAGGQTSRMTRELCDALAALGRIAPVVIALEDFHFADPATIGLLETAAHAVQLGRTLFVVTYRSHAGAGGAAVAKSASALVGRPSVSVVPIGPLSAEAVEELLAARFPGTAPPRALVARVLADTGGNALLVRSLLDAWEARWVAADRAGRRVDPWTEASQSELPDAVRSIVAAELEALEPEARELFELFSVHGESLPVTVAAAALGTTDDQVEVLCARLEADGRFLRRDGVHEAADGRLVDCYAPARPLFAMVCAERVPPARRATWERALAKSRRGPPLAET